MSSAHVWHSLFISPLSIQWTSLMLSSTCPPIPRNRLKQMTRKRGGKNSWIKAIAQRRLMRFLYVSIVRKSWWKCVDIGSLKRSGRKMGNGWSFGRFFEPHVTSISFGVHFFEKYKSTIQSCFFWKSNMPLLYNYPLLACSPRSFDEPLLLTLSIQWAGVCYDLKPRHGGMGLDATEHSKRKAGALDSQVLAVWHK